MLSIPNLTKSDLLALAYNHGNWDGGYYAGSEHAAKVLNLNIKTFRKSVTKLKKLGLWKYRGEAISPRRYSPAREIKALDGALKAPIGEIKAPAGELKAPIGEYKNPVLPLKTEILLDNLLDNKLEKDKKEQLENAGEAAEPEIKNVSSYNFNDLKETIQKKLDTKDIKESRYLDSASKKVNKMDPSKYDFSSYKIFDAEGVPILQGDMVKANYHASMEGLPKPYSKEDIRIAPSSPSAFISVADKKFLEECFTHEQSASAAKVDVLKGS